MTGDGIAIIVFGNMSEEPEPVSDPVVITGQTGITVDDHVEAWIMGTDSTIGTMAVQPELEHNAYEHMIAPIRVTISNIVADTGFTIVGIADFGLYGAFKVRWIWATKTPAP